MKIICPTYKRAGNIKTHQIFGNELILAVIKDESKIYKKHYPNNKQMVLPNELKENMSKIRSYLLHNCRDKHLVMVDDDLAGIGFHEDGQQKIMEESDIIAFFQEGFRMAEELGTVLWGLNLQSDPKFYREYSPFSLTQPILGPITCICTTDHRIDYDERVHLNEDYDISLQVMYHYHKVLRFNKYFYLAGHLKVKGGCGAYRTLTKEKQQADIMIKKWGDIVKYDFSKSTNPRISVPLKGI